jgi:hypothetical protein
MKTKFKTIALAAILSFGFLSVSVAGTPKSDNSCAVRQKIQHAVSLPGELKNPGYSQKVKVSFVLDVSGKVKEVAANTKNPMLKKTLENQFRQIVLSELQAGTYNVELNFNVY